MDIYCQVTPQGLVPLYDSDHEAAHRLRQGAVVKCKVTQPRNYKFHKKFFALVRMVYDNLPFELHTKYAIRTEDDMLRRFKRDLGLYSSTTNEDGEIEIEYGSISFAAMDNYEFEAFYNRCIGLVISKYLKGIDQQDLLNEIENFA